MIFEFRKEKFKEKTAEFVEICVLENVNDANLIGIFFVFGIILRLICSM